jgi:uncharacterized protein (TIGR02265 family)
MPADRHEHQKRLAAAQHADTTRGLNFNTLFVLVREQLGEDVTRAIDSTGKGSRIDFFSYPVQEYLQVAWTAADRLEGKFGGVDGVWRELGRRTVTGFLNSTLGRALFAMAGHDPRRVLSAGPSGYRGAVSYGERKVEWLGEKHARMTFKHDFMPAVFHEAVILTAMQQTEAKSPKVKTSEKGFLDVEYDISWE